MEIRTLKREELSLLSHYASLENWDLEELHMQALFQAYPNDFFIIFLQNKLLGFILAITHEDNFGFISNFLVLKEYQYRGYGTQIFQFALTHLGERQIALDSVSKKEKFYKNFGFTVYFDVCVYKFTLGSVVLDFFSLDNFHINNSISLKNKNEYQKILFSNPNVLCKSIKNGENESSFAYMTPYIDGYKIDIQSTNINEVLALFFAMSSQLKKGTHIYIKVDILSPIVLSIITTLNMQLQRKYTRMYNKIL